MSTGTDEGTRHETELSDAIREMCPWREVGWIFRDGDTLAVEPRATASARGVPGSLI